MDRYTIGVELQGFEKIGLDAMKEKRNSTMVLSASKDNENRLNEYYNAVEQSLDNGNRIVLISEENNKLLKPLASLMMLHKEYDIYTVENMSVVNENYVEKLIERKPTVDEVQTFIGGDVTAYNNAVTILFGIQSLAQEGKDDKLRDFVKEHIMSIGELTSTLNGMKKICDEYNSGELIEQIKRLRDTTDSLGTKVTEQDKEIDSIKQSRDAYKDKLDELTKENIRLKSANNELESSANGGAIIRNYTEVNTHLINCKTKIVLYFKEVSYVSYVNTLIMQLMSILDMHKLKTKLMIYDCNTSLYNIYKPMPIVTGQDYIAMKDTLIRKTKSFVVAEPNQSIISDVLTSDQSFDVLVIYDRMRQGHDLISGNNVSKFYVINSKKDYDEVANLLKIRDTSWVITHSQSTITGSNEEKNFLDIPSIQGFSSLTASAKTARYMRLITTVSKSQLINTILSKSRISTLMKEA